MKSTTFLRTRQPSEALDQIDERRRMVALDLQCSRGMHGVQPGTLRLVARPLPVRGCHFHCIRSAQISLRRVRLRMAAASLAAAPRSAASALACAPPRLPIRSPSPSSHPSRCCPLCEVACTAASGRTPCHAAAFDGELTLALTACASQRCCCGSPAPSLRVTSPSPTAT